MARTVDAGTHWLNTHVTIDQARSFGGFAKVQAVSATEAWAGGDDSLNAAIWHTSDGGATWEKRSDIPRAAYDWCFSGQIGLAVGSSFETGGHGRVLRSVDGGRTWNLVTGLSDAAINESVDIAGSTAYTCDGFGYIYRSTDSGASWSKIDTGEAGDDDEHCFTAIECLDTDPKCVWAATIDGQILRSTDGFATWTEAGPYLHASVNPYESDTTAPVLTFSVPNARSFNHDVDVTISATDTGGCGVASIVTMLDAQIPATVSWSGSTAHVQVAAPTNHAGDGVHEVDAQAVDQRGNAKGARISVIIDTKAPSVAVTKNVTVKKGKKASVTARVTEPPPSIAKLTLVMTIRKKSGKVVKTVMTAPEQAGQRAFTFKCTLAKATYKFTIVAIDEAGNKSNPSATHNLYVK